MPAALSTGSPAVLLVPTALEARELAALGGFPPGLAVEVECGFGPLASAARAAALLARLRPSRVLLLGIAGTYDERSAAVGAAVRIGRVAIDGLETAGFRQAPGIGRSLRVAAGPDALLVTVLRASASPLEAGERRERHPGAVAEDMEGFGVALACAIERVPLAIVRGISNVAGDRDTQGWRIRDALGAARELAIDLLRRPGDGVPPR